MIRVVIPYHLRTLAKVNGEVRLELDAPASIGDVLDALEQVYPLLRGTLRDHTTKQRRPFIRYFACKTDLSNEPSTTLLPDAVLEAREPFMIIGAMAGG